jgi:hypothetical protein
MQNLGEDRLRKDRQHLKRALHDVESGGFAGLPQGERDTIRDLLILRIAEIDRVLDSDG